MIEEGGVYKLKKIKDFIGTNIDDEFKVLKISGDTVYCQNQETKELNMFNKKDFIDPEYPDNIYSDFKIVYEKLNNIVKPSDETFWKELQEEMGGGFVGATAVSGGMASMGAAPCPAMGQITGGNISGCLINGVPVAGESVKKKKKKKSKKDEAFFTKDRLRSDLTPDEVQEYNDIKNKEEYLNDDSASPEFIFKHADDPEIEFEDAINLLLFGQNEADKEEYNELIAFIDEAGKLEEYEKYALDKYGINDITGDSIGNQVDITVEDIVDEIFNEDFNEEYEEITEQIAKYLDRLNFKFANTEDIVYKKEGEYKYLFKFDNEIGIIKIKVLHGDEILVEKEYEIDETKDIQPIFDEIESIYKKYGL